MSLAIKIYNKLIQVPKGKVITYSELANSVGLANGQRAVGNIVGKNPFPLIIPCHRVVKSNGQIGGYAYGVRMKSNLLKKEGIKIQKGKILDFEKRNHHF